ncbi:MAG: TetR/AcrR family transcriptional regulator [Myxococcales bacterium]
MRSLTQRSQTRRSRAREQRLERIRAAGARVFARHGYDRATMDQVAEEADLGKATLYYYFPTKHDLFADLVAHAAQQLREGLDAELPAGGDPLDLAERLCLFSVRYFRRDPDMAALLMPLMAGGWRQLGMRLGEEVAGQMAAAHSPLLAHLGPVFERLPRGETFVQLVSSVLLGVAAKLQAGAAIDAEAEMSLLFELVRRSGSTHGD